MQETFSFCVLTAAAVVFEALLVAVAVKKKFEGGKKIEIQLKMECQSGDIFLLLLRRCRRCRRRRKKTSVDLKIK
jgi:hypothetical protein